MYELTKQFEKHLILRSMARMIEKAVVSKEGVYPWESSVWRKEDVYVEKELVKVPYYIGLRSMYVAPLRQLASSLEPHVVFSGITRSSSQWKARLFLPIALFHTCYENAMPIQMGEGIRMYITERAMNNFRHLFGHISYHLDGRASGEPLFDIRPYWALG